MGSAMENVATNGPAGPVAMAQAAALAMPTLLGRAAPRIPVAGRIRAGIKVLTRRAAENEQVRAIYERGVMQGKSFDTIEREIAETVPDLKYPLTPKNVPYFTVRGEDFPNPEIARQITDLFGEDRGDGVKRLYRFPVVFPADAWQSVMPLLKSTVSAIRSTIDASRATISASAGGSSSWFELAGAVRDGL